MRVRADGPSGSAFTAAQVACKASAIYDVPGAPVSIRPCPPVLLSAPAFLPRGPPAVVEAILPQGPVY
jgi:hypothetical protein